jgi:hypothetical protein
MLLIFGYLQTIRVLSSCDYLTILLLAIAAMGVNIMRLDRFRGIHMEILADLDVNYKYLLVKDASPD